MSSFTFSGTFLFLLYLTLSVSDTFRDPSICSHILREKKPDAVYRHPQYTQTTRTYENIVNKIT